MSSQTFRIHRLALSSYLRDDFPAMERRRLASLDGIEWIDSLRDRPHILLTNTDCRMEEIPTSHLEQVELIIHPNSGYDNFSLEFVQNFKGHVVTGNRIRASAVAQYVLDCLFERYGRAPFGERRQWRRQLLGRLNILIVGLGHIGEILLSTFKSLGANCRVYDPYRGYCKWDDGDLDALILCCGQNQKNTPLLGAARLRELSPEITLINPARGKLIDESALIDFLRQNPKARAYLDVAEREGALSELPNVVLTPHIAGVFQGIDREIVEFEAEVVENFIFRPQAFGEIYRESLLANKIRDGILI